MTTPRSDAAPDLPDREAAFRPRDVCVTPDTGFVDVVFDGPPSHESGRFVEVENDKGASIRFGEWVHRPDGFWALRITRRDVCVDPAKVEANRSRAIQSVILVLHRHGMLPPYTTDLTLIAADIADAALSALDGGK